jgi:integrase/recombinase XerC
METAMNMIYYSQQKTLRWLVDSALAPHIDAYVAYFESGRYPPNSIRRYLACISHFARWMKRKRLVISNINEDVIAEFLDDHLPHCDCLAPVVQVRQDLHAACVHLLRVLRNSGAIPIPALANDPVDEELRNFDAYMRDAQGLTAKTRQNRLRIVRRFLFARFAKCPIDISLLLPSDVRKFIAEQLAQRGTVSNASRLSSALRAYFRYRTTRGDHLYALTSVISSPAHWSLASLPQSLSADEIDRLLKAFPPNLPSFRRGYAMVCCAFDLGLRSSEIAKLALTDIDWINGSITIRHNKSNREDILPMPTTTGQAIMDYLRFERPPTTNAEVFVRLVAPHDTPISPDAVRKVISNAYHRIGITHSRTHALRHTMARRLLEHGSSLKEVADVLRHRSLNTSLIYAKLDSRSLIAVALPWPGSAA